MSIADDTLDFGGYDFYAKANRLTVERRSNTVARLIDRTSEGQNNLRSFPRMSIPPSRLGKYANRTLCDALVAGHYCVGRATKIGPNCCRVAVSPFQTFLQQNGTAVASWQ